MENNIAIDSTLCKKCNVCVDVCPNGIFRTDKNLISVKSERIELCFLCGQCMASCSEKAIQVLGLDYNKDFFDLPETINSFDTLIQSRRSVRAFKNNPVPKDILEQIVNALTFAPPSFPPLKTEIVVVQDKKLIEQALPHMVNWYDNLIKRLKNPLVRYIIRRKAGSERFQTIQNHVVPMFNIKLPSMITRTEDAITRDAQAMILFHADKHSDNYREDIYIMLGYALLKAHSLGIGASAIDLIPPAIEKVTYLKRLFQIPAENEVVASMILGYPKHKYKRAIRRQLKTVTWI
jgi:nitroreductase/NAD-dependent dihydropyrimidine dehydrogenase PreA subunit